MEQCMLVPDLGNMMGSLELVDEEPLSGVYWI